MLQEEDKLKLINDFVFVDLQGFKAKRQTFIVKEFCLLDGGYQYHAIIKSPFKFDRLTDTYKRQANYLTKHFHGIPFDLGDISREQFTEVTFPRIKERRILVKGSEKVYWMKKVFQKKGEIDCVNIEDLIWNWHVESHEEYEICEYHNLKFGWSPCVCALSNAIKIKENWISYSVLNTPAVDANDQNGLVQ